MGWVATLTCDEEIWVEEIESIVEDMPEEFRGFIPKKHSMKQENGFPTYATIGIPIKNEVSIYGSYIMTTEEKSVRFIKYLIDELKKFNHKNIKFEVDESECKCLFHLEDNLKKLLEYERKKNESI